VSVNGSAGIRLRGVPWGGGAPALRGRAAIQALRPAKRPRHTARALASPRRRLRAMLRWRACGSFVRLLREPCDGCDGVTWR